MMNALLLQVNQKVFAGHIRPLIESEISCGWQLCDQNTLVVLLAASRRKFVSIDTSLCMSLFQFEIHLLHMFLFFAGHSSYNVT